MIQMAVSSVLTVICGILTDAISQLQFFRRAIYVPTFGKAEQDEKVIKT